MASQNPTDNNKTNENENAQQKQVVGESSLSEAEKFLESLNLGDAQPNESGNTDTAASSSTDHKDIMSFLDEISQYPSEEQQSEKKKEKAPATTTTTTVTENTLSSTEQQASSGGGWMAWGNTLWNQASEAVKTTTEQINRSVESPAAKLLEDRVKNLQGYVNKENLGKLGSELRNLTHSILETVAPPISEHELVEVWLSHDMRGYVGLEALVYRAFARVMEQTESGHVVVRKIGDKEDEEDDQPRNLNICEGLLEGTKLAQANLEHLVKTHYKEPEARTEYSPQLGAVPVINCPVFLAIQPISMEDQVVFVLLLVDPTHQLNFKTYSQSMPLAWLDIPFEENEWVEDKMVEAIRLSVTTVAQDYVYTRMSGAKNELAKAVAAAAASNTEQSEKQQGKDEKKDEKNQQVKTA
ncbi:maintenance of telomere capping protein 1 [Circinella umbellata]|nr:maintenance of telomere capping protein 1 [Circinella umbellata]